jgi:hypothetical protein
MTPKHRRFLLKRFQTVHQQYCHVDIPTVRRRWKQAHIRMQLSFGSDRASSRYLQKNTAHRWL